MSEYWKSTPRYWCKHCKTFVRDTKLERQNHDATAKHQGNLKRFIRDLHREHDKDAKDKERAKLEISRLNGIVSGSSVGESRGSETRQAPRPYAPKLQPTPSQRKQQLAQLAEMGVSIPEEFRGEMAMAGEWQVTSERTIMPSDAERSSESIGIGVRKRSVHDDEEEGATKTRRKRWGTDFLAHTQETEDDLDALLCKPIAKQEVVPPSRVIKQESVDSVGGDLKVTAKADYDCLETLDIKKEVPGDELDLSAGAGNSTNVGIEQAGIVFKKRAKAKNIRQK